jgi:hypothetical protein
LEDLDIRHITNSMRILHFMVNIMFDKYQQQIIPYAKEMLITNKSTSPALDIDGPDFDLPLTLEVLR